MKFVLTRSSVHPSTADSPPALGAVWEELERPGYGKASVWTIEVNDLDELLLLGNHNDGRLIVSNRNQMFPDMPGLEIYDDWRE